MFTSRLICRNLCLLAGTDEMVKVMGVVGSWEVRRMGRVFGYSARDST